MSTRRVAVIGLDGADAGTLEALLAAGELPALAGLAERGSLARLASTADCFAASVWPCFYYGVHPGKHNLCGSFPTVRGTLDVEPADAARNPWPAFPAAIRDPGKRSLVIDVPKSRPEPGLRGVSVVGWGAHAPCHDFATTPRGLGRRLRRELGRYPLALGEEDKLDGSEAYLRALRGGLLEGVRAKLRLTRVLAEREPWSLLVSVFGEIHSAGHRFLHFVTPRDPACDPDAPPELREALYDVYRETDAALGELLRILPEETDVLVCSVHGMAPNWNAQELLPRLLERMEGVEPPAGDAGGHGGGWLGLRTLLPAGLRDRVKLYVPRAVRDRIRTRHTKELYGSRHWPKMRAFALPTDDCGYIRVNLRGREPDGLVEPGAGYEALLEELTEEMESLRDVKTGEPVVAKVSRPQERWPGPFSDLMPDLALEWAARGPVSGLRSPRYGEIRAETRLQHRTGIHRAEGFAVGAGPGLRAGARLDAPHILDLAPTILALLGEEPPPHMDGRVLAEWLAAG